jgi:hypothetical protein
VTSSTLIEIKLSASDQVFVGGRNGTPEFRRAATDGGMDGREHQRGLPAAWRNIGANFRVSQT